MAPYHAVSIVKSCENDGIWYLYFDGSKSPERVGGSFLLIDPKGNKTSIDYRLEFDCLDNTTEYESLLQGLKKVIDLDVQCLVAFDDSEIVVKQVKNVIHCLSTHLKNYLTEVWNLINKFLSFNISSIPKSSNFEADLLENVASKLLPAEGFSPNSFSIELMFRLSIPDNIINWQEFDNDQQIIFFLHMEDTFQGVVIDENTHDKYLRDFSVIYDPRLAESSSDMVNYIPKSIVRLDNFYDLHDKFRGVVKCKTNSSSLQYETVNLGTQDNPQNINLGKGCNQQEKSAFIKLFK
jgi:ribonuclease HI